MEEALEENAAFGCKEQKGFPIFAGISRLFHHFPLESPCEAMEHRMVFYIKNHRAATSLAGGWPTRLREDKIEGEDTKNSSDPVWAFQLSCENPIALNSSDLSYFLETDVSTAYEVTHPVFEVFLSHYSLHGFFFCGRGQVMKRAKTLDHVWKKEMKMNYWRCIKAWPITLVSEDIKSWNPEGWKEKSRISSS